MLHQRIRANIIIDYLYPPLLRTTITIFTLNLVVHYVRFASCPFKNHLICPIIQSLVIPSLIIYRAHFSNNIIQSLVILSSI